MISGLNKPWMLGDGLMRRDLRLLCQMLRHEVLEDNPTDVWDEVILLRKLATRHEKGDSGAERELAVYFQNVPLERINLHLRILGIFFDFANATEDIQRERVLKERQKNKTLTDGLEARLQTLYEKKGDYSLCQELQAEFVFTAHPTEAKRQTVRRILARLRNRLRRLSFEKLNREERKEIIRRLHEDVRALLRTDPLHSHRPDVLEELGRVLYVSDTLWKSSPKLLKTIEHVIQSDTQAVRFGCWVGGDRDGHPHVTVDITRQTLEKLRIQAIDFHLTECRTLRRLLTMLCKNQEVIPSLESIVTNVQSTLLEDRLVRFHPHEYYRRALETIRFRLKASKPYPEEQNIGYKDGAELAQDLSILSQALKDDLLEGFALEKLTEWQRKTRIFGLQLMRLDIRENSDGYRDLMRSLLLLFNEAPERVDRNDFEGLWDFKPDFPEEESLRDDLSERNYDLLAVTRLMQDWAALYGTEGIGANVISMTHSKDDVLWVLWLHNLVAHWRGTPDVSMSISPLFETIDDLNAAAGILTELFQYPAFADRLSRQDNKQHVMVGYSDSAKDGGYLAACWALYNGQKTMLKASEKANVQLICFHGRGGALGRGGGPAARAIQALPPSPSDAHIRMTEQGEVIADRFADPVLAHRHMEQILGGLILHAADAQPPTPEWQECMDLFAAQGRTAYLDLFQSEGFPTYFQQATPFNCIVNLPIGSRPSRRHGVNSLEDLRAIPYTFSWTQSRQLINAFYGLGSAWKELSEAHRDQLRAMYKTWAFFRSMMDNAELALTKCDPVIAQEYAALVEDQSLSERLGKRIVDEMAYTETAILEINGRKDLMGESTWLQRSVEIRKPFIDVLNHIQIELIKRQRKESQPDEFLTRNLRLSVQAIASGLRTTG